MVQHRLEASDHAAILQTVEYLPVLHCPLACAMGAVAVNRLATSITRLTLSQVTADEIDAATKLLDKACQKLRGTQMYHPRELLPYVNYVN